MDATATPATTERKKNHHRLATFCLLAPFIAVALNFFIWAPSWAQHPSRTRVDAPADATLTADVPVLGVIAGVISLLPAEVTRLANLAASTPPIQTANDKDHSLLTSAATSHWDLAVRDYTRTLTWVDRFPAIAKESREPFVEKRREVYLKLGRKAESDADERELKAGAKQ